MTRASLAIVALFALASCLTAQTSFNFVLDESQEVPPTGSSALGVAFAHLDASAAYLRHAALLTVHMPGISGIEAGAPRRTWRRRARPR